MQRFGAGYSGDLGTFRATHEVYGVIEEAQRLSEKAKDKDRIFPRRNERPNDSMEIMTAEESMAHISKNLGCSRMEAATHLGSGPKAYSRGLYRKADLDSWIEEQKKGKRFVASELEKKQHGPDREVFHLLDKDEAAAAIMRAVPECSKASALAALAGKDSGIPSLARYGGRYYKDTDLKTWIEQHSLKLAMPPGPWKPAVEHA